MNSSERRPQRRPALMAALGAVLLVFVGATALWQLEPAKYSATTTLVVLPQGAAADAASYYDTMSRGQIQETFAQILALRGSAAAGDTVKVSVVPNTSLIKVVATAPDARRAENTADQTLARVQPYFKALNEHYGVSVVEGAAGTAARSGLTLAVLVGVAAAVAAVVAIATYLSVRGIQHARWSALGGARSAPQVPRTVPAAAVDAGQDRTLTGARRGS